MRPVLLLRLYGDEFDAEERERILSRLGGTHEGEGGAREQVGRRRSLTADPGEWSCRRSVRNGAMPMPRQVEFVETPCIMTGSCYSFDAEAPGCEPP